MRNAHDIAIELEHILCKEFAFEGRPRGTIFDADLIESYMFYDVLYLLLYKCSKSDFTTFVDKNFKYKGINMNLIENSEEIFSEFKSFLA